MYANIITADREMGIHYLDGNEGIIAAALQALADASKRKELLGHS